MFLELAAGLGLGSLLFGEEKIVEHHYILESPKPVPVWEAPSPEETEYTRLYRDEEKTFAWLLQNLGWYYDHARMGLRHPRYPDAFLYDYYRCRENSEKVLKLVGYYVEHKYDSYGLDDEAIEALNTAVISLFGVKMNAWNVLEESKR